MMRIQAALLALVVLLLGSVASRGQEVSAEDGKTLSDAQTALNDGKFADAVKLLEPLRKKYPKLADIPRLLTHAYFELDEPKKARIAALEAISAGRLAPDLLARLAAIDEQRDDQLALLNIVRLLTILDEDNRQWRLLYADLLEDAGQLDASAAAYRTLIKEQPQSAQLHLRLGNVLLRQNKLAESVVELATAWHLGAANPKLPLMLAGSWQQLGDLRQSREWLERAAALQPADDSLKLRAAQLCLTQNALDRAQELATSLINSKIAATRAQSHVLLGQVALKRELPEQAIDHWRKAADEQPQPPELLIAIGAFHFNQSDFAMAAKYLEQAVKENGEPDEQSLRFLVISLIRQGDRAKSKTYLQRYIELNGLNDTAREMITEWSKPKGGA